MKLTFVDSPEQGNVNLDLDKLAVIIDAILAKYDGLTNFSDLYLRQAKGKDDGTVYYPPFAGKKRVINTFIYSGDIEGLII